MTYKNKKVGSNPGLPQAWITSTKNRKRTKETKGEKIVYLKDGEEFEIELFNPTKSPVLAKIKLNGNYISSRGIILDPGQRWFLDRYIDKDRKFSFSTYEVNNTEEVREAISDNGLVEIVFYPEVVNLNIGTGTWSPPYWQRDWSQPYLFYGDPGTGTEIPSFTTISSNEVDLSSDITNAGTLITNTSFNYSADIDISEVSNNAGKKKETGRVKEGDKSDQSFSEGSGEFSSFSSNTCKYKIMPLSTKPVKREDLRKYCTGCGFRIRKSSWTFCPSCGTKIE